MIIRQINDVERLVEHSTQHDTIGSVMSTISVSSSNHDVVTGTPSTSVICLIITYSHRVRCSRQRLFIVY